MICIPGPPSDVASIDFEVYSEAGFLFRDNKWKSQVDKKPGIKGVGTYNYAVHPSTRVLSLAWDLHDGCGIRIWFPGLPNPKGLFDHIASGGLVEAHNSIFEYWIWNHVMHYWPPLPLEQLTCTMSRCSASGLPGALKDVHKAINLPVTKQDIGKDLIRRLCVPNNYKKPKYNMGQLHEYCMYDVATEDAISARIPQLSDRMRRIWLMDQRINDRGVQVDVVAARALAGRVEKYVKQAGRQLRDLTSGAADSPRQVERICSWLECRGMKIKRTKKRRYKFDKEAVEELLAEVEEGSIEEQVLNIRQQFSLASVDKIKTLCHMVDSTGRLRGVFRFHGAHTGRWTSLGVQLQNPPRGTMNPEEVHNALEAIKCDDWTHINEEAPLATISSLVRGLFIAAPGHDLMSADFSAIEGVGAAMLSGEQWRIDVFRGDGRIYENTASDLTGIPLEEILAYKDINGKHHPLRGLGKTGELSSQYQGWINAWLRFGVGKYIKDREEIKKAILTWRAKSPMICEIWGGQLRKHPERWEYTPELYGIEGCVVNALTYPDEWFSYRTLSFKHDTVNDVLLMRLPSGRCLWYRQPRLHRKFHKQSERLIWKITYKSWSSQDGWHDKETFGGRIFENADQAVCCDIHADAMLRLEEHGYPVVIHVHDEPVEEMPEGYGSLEEIQELMCRREGWYADWPIRTDPEGAWRGLRFRK